jgi:hypothetical protein
MTKNRRRRLFWDSIAWGTYFRGMQPPSIYSDKRPVEPKPEMYTLSVVPDNTNRASWLNKLLQQIIQWIEIKLGLKPVALKA